MNQKSKSRYKVTIQGIVQGVGFRPFVYQQAVARRLTGYVTNTSHGVDLEVEGEETVLDDFLRVLRLEAPPLSRITSLEFRPLLPQGDSEFTILKSQAQETRSALISPDVAVCPDCLRELRDPRDRRYRYPFINCTNCGPRYTIIKDIPYDRAKTTMSAFTLCPECSAEYHDPLNRRFHAQPNACWTCGPRVALLDGAGQAIDCEDPIAETARLLREGWVVAIKGLGGFHLAVEAVQEEAVRRLRQRKHREEKPLALMCPDLDRVRAFARIETEEEEVLLSRERPIILLKKK